MSISPDTPNILPVIERLIERKIKVFMTHTHASVEQTLAAIDAGACHGTHFYNVFPVPPEVDPGARPVGAVETILADARVSVDFICDGVHVHPMAIKAAMAAKRDDQIILITDSNIGAGLADGMYPTDWGYPVKVEAGRATRIHDPKHPNHGALAGSSLTMDQGINHLLSWLEVPEAAVWAMGTRNVSAMLGLENKGVIRVGADGDLVLWDRKETGLCAARTWVGGECVFDVTRDTVLETR